MKDFRIPSDFASDHPMRFPCAMCGQSFDPPGEWRFHINDVHGLELLKRDPECCSAIEMYVRVLSHGGLQPRCTVRGCRNQGCRQKWSEVRAGYANWSAGAQRHRMSKKTKASRPKSTAPSSVQVKC